MSDEIQTSPSNDVVVVSSVVEPPLETTTPTQTQTYQLTLDGPLLKQQLTILKALLRQLPDNRVELAGVVQLLQELAYQAYDNYAMDSVDEEPLDAIVGYAQRHDLGQEELAAAVLEITRRHPASAIDLAASLLETVPADALRSQLAALVAERKRKSMQPVEPAAPPPAEPEPPTEEVQS